MQAMCEKCANKCTAYEGIKSQPNLKLIDCDHYTTKVNLISCHWCDHANLWEEREWIYCRCGATGLDRDALYPDNCEFFTPIEGVIYESNK